MTKPIIGILPISNYLLTDDTFKDTYRFCNNYIKKIYDNGAVPLLIPYKDNEIIKESLEICDALLIPGGDRILPVTFSVIDYFYQNDKPILGICLGMQALAMYSIKEEKIIHKVDNHYPLNVTRDNNNVLVHDILIEKDSLLYNILNSDVIKVNSLHNYAITKVGNGFKIAALSNDNVIEAIEAKNKKFVLGLQFHPETDKRLNNIFVEFINYAKRD